MRGSSASRPGHFSLAPAGFNWQQGTNSGQEPIRVRNQQGQGTNPPGALLAKGNQRTAVKRQPARSRRPTIDALHRSTEERQEEPKAKGNQGNRNQKQQEPKARGTNFGNGNQRQEEPMQFNTAPTAFFLNLYESSPSEAGRRAHAIRRSAQLQALTITYEEMTRTQAPKGTIANRDSRQSSSMVILVRSAGKLETRHGGCHPFEGWLLGDRRRSQVEGLLMMQLNCDDLGRALDRALELDRASKCS